MHVISTQTRDIYIYIYTGANKYIFVLELRYLFCVCECFYVCIEARYIYICLYDLQFTHLGHACRFLYNRRQLWRSTGTISNKRSPSG